MHMGLRDSGSGFLMNRVPTDPRDTLRPGGTAGTRMVITNKIVMRSGRWLQGFMDLGLGV